MQTSAGTAPSGQRPLTALLAPDTRLVAFVGAGGKTTSIYTLGRQLVAQGKRVVVTTTTHMFPPERDLLLLTPQSVIPASYTLLTVGAGVSNAHKLVGFAPEAMAELFARFAPDLILVEADGAARHCIKAPERHEPVIPKDTDLVVGVLGLDALGKIVDAETVFRLERFCAVTGLAPGDTIGPAAFAALAAHPEGLFKGAPDQARRIAFHNKADTYPPLGPLYGSARGGWFCMAAA